MPYATTPCPAVRPGTEQLLEAVTDLCSRAGAHHVEIGYALRSGRPGSADWFAFTAYEGSQLSERGHPSPAAACYALACRLVAGTVCACGLAVALDPGEGCAGLPRPWPGGRPRGVAQAQDAGWCLWRLGAQRWRPSCGLMPRQVAGAVPGSGGAGGAGGDGGPGTPALRE